MWYAVQAPGRPQSLQQQQQQQQAVSHTALSHPGNMYGLLVSPCFVI